MSGGFNIGSIISQVALAAVTGGTSLAITQAIQQVVKSVVANLLTSVIQNVGQQLGLPQGIIDFASNAALSQFGMSEFGSQSLNGAMDNLGSLTGMNPFEQQSMSDSIMDTIALGSKQMTESLGREAEKEARGEGTGSEGGSILMRIAEALGEAADQKLNQMLDFSSQIDSEIGKSQDFIDFNGKFDKRGRDASQANLNQSKIGSLQAKFQASSQEFNILQNTISTVLKTIGEGVASIARKQ